MKIYRLTAPDGSIYESTVPGDLGGYSCERIYGQLDCWSARLALPKGYAQHRVFFADEAAAIAAGYRPCAKCMPVRYKVWKQGGELETANYPWKTLPKLAK
ncbi:metal binding Ada-like protein [Roseimicrobium gellanilyticum]|uniref:Metal binding Ada-like protein n=1 Tax=Roseimicrobium gellanilyticum TaxID=748857 RepID=A0A366HQY1_9BACT|nr:Ada metal-binding domain-containing protein [Roseimicrobium gellanilyticum]RBP45218.1 metal binding Ada-like protein [Roseimicrobium gellanilyticum]